MDPVQLMQSPEPSDLDAESESLLEELAYRCAMNGGPRVAGFAEAMGLSRSRFVALVTHPRFDELLLGYTKAYVYLPHHRDLEQRRIDLASAGGIETLEHARPGGATVKVVEKVVERSLEGPPNEILSAFTESLSDRRTTFADAPHADGGVRGEVLPPSVQGSARVKPPAEDA